jgi:Cysteine-rich secretory protein family
MLKQLGPCWGWVGVLSMGLTACGGGGSGGSTPSAPATSAVVSNPSVVPLSVDIVTTAPPSPSTCGVEELAAFNRFNGHRAQCGFGYLAQNAALDASAANHLNWMVANNTVSHSEVSGTTGYTGSTSQARMIAAGYSSGTQFGEVLTGGTGIAKTGFGVKGARILLAAPYHLAGLMASHRDIGISLKSGGNLASGADITSAGSSSVTWLVANMAASSTNLPQLQSSNEVLTYPCQGITDTDYEVRAESPNPVPGRDLSTQPIGHPIFVQALKGRSLVISSVTVTGPTGTVSLLPTMTSSNDPNAVLGSHQAIVIPSAPLSANSSYIVAVSGTQGGSSFNKSFVFTTRP